MNSDCSLVLGLGDAHSGDGASRLGGVNELHEVNCMNCDCETDVH